MRQLKANQTPSSEAEVEDLLSLRKGVGGLKEVGQLYAQPNEIQDCHIRQTPC